MSILNHPEFDNHEQVIFCRNERVGLKAIIAIHNTNLGPAAGGCRMYPYPNEEAALYDVLRLSKGMSYKNALAGLSLGGGKSVIIADSTPSPQKDELLKALADQVQYLGGRYWTAIDVGVSVQDCALMNTVCDYIFSLANEDLDPPRPNPSHFTSLGGYVALKAAVKYRMKRNSLEGARVAVQGVGNTGEKICRMLHEEGVHLTVTDVDEAAVERVVSAYGAKAVSPDEIYRQDVDALVPCAMGAVINDNSIDQLKVKVIAGVANNQLAEPRHGEVLKKKGILFVPDYVSSAGGMMFAADDIFNKNDQEASVTKIHGIAETLATIFERDEREAATTTEIADEMAREKIAGK
jgi:leucine dehydrogenase